MEPVFLVCQLFLGYDKIKNMSKRGRYDEKANFCVSR